MGWLQPGTETLPCDRRIWLASSSGCVFTFPSLEAEETLDTARRNHMNMRWLTRTQRRSKGETAGILFLAQSYKRAENWSEAAIRANIHTGGYTVYNDDRLGPVETEFPIIDNERRGTTVERNPIDACLDTGRKGPPPPIDQVREVALCGDNRINQYGSLHMYLRDVQETKMKSQEHLSHQDALHLKDNVELRADILELHRLGAIPKFRGPTPGNFRVLGLRHNVVEQDFALSKIRGYVEQGKISVWAARGLTSENRFFSTTPSTVAKKLPTEPFRPKNVLFGMADGPTSGVRKQTIGNTGPHLWWG